MDVILAFFSDNFWATAALLGGIGTSITGVINGKFNINGVWQQIIAWIVAVVLTVGGYFLNVITVADPVWLTLTLTGLIVGLVSNGVYDIPTIKAWIDSWFKPKKA